MRRGILYALLAGLLYAVVGVVTKFATQEATVPTVAFFRQLFGLLAISPMLYIGRKRLKPERPGLLVLRAFVSLAAMYMLLFALQLLPVSDAILLSYTRPLWLPLIILVWLRKRLEPAIWIGLGMGFVGVALILKPETGLFELGALAGLASGLLGAWAFLLIRRLGRSETPLRIMGFHFSCTMLLTLIPMWIWWRPIGGQYWAALALIGALGALYQYFLTQAYRHARATLVGGLLYSAVIFSLILDAILWRQFPDLFAIVGILLVCSGSIISIVWQRERIAPGEQSATATVEKR